jgi:hypothetical protein
LRNRKERGTLGILLHPCRPSTPDSVRYGLYDSVHYPKRRKPQFISLKDLSTHQESCTRKPAWDAEPLILSYILSRVEGHS